MTSATEDAREILARALKLSRARVPADGTVETVPGWDSLSHFAVIGEIESHIRRPLTTAEIAGLRSVQDIIRILGSFEDWQGAGAARARDC